jgi:Mrp family chromosome partitioning ATPase
MKIVVRSLVRWSWLLLLSMAVGFVVGRLLTALLPPTYQSTAFVQLNAQSRNDQVQIIQSISVYGMDVTSDAVLNPVFKRYHNLDRANFIAKQLVVTTDTLSQTIEIQVTMPGPKLCANIANMLAQALVAQQNAAIQAQYTKEVQLLTNRIAAEQKQITQWSQQYDATPAADTNALTQLDNQIQQERALQNNDIAAQQQLQTEQAIYGNPLVVARAATVANKPSSIIGLVPFTPTMIVLFLIIGLLTIAFLEQSAGRVNEAYELQQKLTLPVLGALRWTQSPTLSMLNTPNPYAEECRMMMADVLFQAEQERAHVIAIAGTRSSAGASMITAELAILLAQSKRRVLLVDANLHHPSVHELLRVPNDAGLAKILEEARVARPNALGIAAHTQSLPSLTERMSLESFIMPTNYANLYVVPAGRAQASPADLLNMPEMGQFLQWAAKPVDYVLLDCPAFDHSETHVLGALTDQTLVVVDATKDRTKPIINLKNDLANTGIKLAGLIVNKLGRWI